MKEEYIITDGIRHLSRLTIFKDGTHGYNFTTDRSKALRFTDTLQAANECFYMAQKGFAVYAEEA